MVFWSSVDAFYSLFILLLLFDGSKKKQTIFSKASSPNLGKFKNNSAQLTFTCLKSTIETLETGVKYVQS